MSKRCVKYVVTLTEEERGALQELVSAGRAAARKWTHARILLQADSGPDGPGGGDAEITAALDVGHATAERVRQRFVEEGLEAALERRRSSAERKIGRRPKVARVKKKVPPGAKNRR